MFYILDDDKNVVEVDDIRIAGQWFQTLENRRVGRDVIGNKLVSTVFLGVDHSFGGGRPAFFETMIFNNDDQYGDSETEGRASTWTEAEKLHRETCERLRIEMQSAWM